MNNITVNWYDNDETIVYYKFIGKWTWDDFYPILQEALAMERAKDHRVDVIMDFLESNNIPPNMFTHLKSITDNQPDNLGLSVFVTTNRFGISMINMAAKIYPRIKEVFDIAETIEEAAEIIAQARQPA